MIVFVIPLVCPQLSASESKKTGFLTVNLWPDTVPGEKTNLKETKKPSQGDGVTRITNISNPSITIFRARNAAAPTPGIIICPGGGYSILAIDKEGTEVAQWLNTTGITAAVLKYRVPQNRPGAFQDARRAVRVVRYHADDWGIDPNCIGILGFSAGGHLAARVSTDFQSILHHPVDQADHVFGRPDFTILIYPAYLYQKDYKLAEEITVTQQTPPAFIVQTQDDRKFVNSSLAYYTALTKASVQAELHIFEKGGHGYGLCPSKHPVSGWPKLCEAWMKSNGVIK
ncbi:MAG: alpha/beta hydrolase [Planctomycetota bacterium]